MACLTIRARIPPSPKSVSLTALKRLATDRVYVFANLGMTVEWVGIWIPLNFIVVYGIAKGMPSGLAQYLVPIMNAAP